MKKNAKGENKKGNAGWNAFLKLRSQVPPK
jgi:hypothetical protein